MAVAALKNRDGLWFGWSGKVTDEQTGEPRAVDVNKVTYVLIDLSKTDIQEYYNGLANSVLWPILHYRVRISRSIPAPTRAVTSKSTGYSPIA